MKAQAAAAKAYHKSQSNWFARHKFLTGLGALILLIVIIVASSSSGGDDAVNTTDGGSSSNDAPSNDAPASADAFGTPIRGDKFTVTLTQSSACAKGATACAFKAKYENKGNENKDEFLASDDFKLFDKKGRSFDSTVFEALDIQPGSSKNVDINFEGLPADFEPDRIEADTGGADISIKF